MCDGLDRLQGDQFSEAFYDRVHGFCYEIWNGVDAFTHVALDLSTNLAHKFTTKESMQVSFKVFMSYYDHAGYGLGDVLRRTLRVTEYMGCPSYGCTSYGLGDHREQSLKSV